MSRAAGLLLTLLVAGPLSAQPASKLVPREPLATLRIDHPRRALLLLPLAGQSAEEPPWGLIGLPALEGVGLEAPWYVFLSAYEGRPQFSALLPLTDVGAFERSLLGAPDGIGFDREGDHVLIGDLPLPKSGGALPTHLSGDALELRAHPRRVVQTFRESLELFLFETAAQAPRLQAEARGEIYSPYELGELRETASSAFESIVAVLEQCTLLTVQARPVQELVRFHATLGFEPRSEIAVTLDQQPLTRPIRILELDPELPYHQWSNLRLAESPLLRRLAAHWASELSGLPLERAERLVLDGESVVGVGDAFAEREVETIEWPRNVTLADYRTTVRDVHLGIKQDGLGAARSYDTNVFRTDSLAVDRLTLSFGTSQPRDALARVESYFGWTGTKLIHGASIGDAPEKGLKRVLAAASRAPAPERTLDALSHSIPETLLWLSRSDAGSWDRIVQKHVPSEDRVTALESRPERPVFLIYATSYSGTLEIGGWIDRLQQGAMATRLRTIAHLAERYRSDALRNEPEEEAQILERAARLGNVDAQVRLGWNHQAGRGVPVDYAKAAFWYRVAAVQGSADGQRRVGDLFFYELGGTRDYEEARSWYELAAARNQILAQYNLGRIYRNGWGVEKNPEEAFEWFSRSAAQGHALSQSELGRAYRYGLGVERNIDEAERWLLRAVEKDHAPAMGMLGDLYSYAKGDDVTAVDWYRKGADHGNDDSRYELARSYDNGWGVEADSAHALALYQELAAKPGSHQHRAEFRIGLLYSEGRLGDKDPKQAASWLFRAAEGGNSTAQLRMYHVHLEGDGVPEDRARAMEWLRRAAEQDDAEAMAALGWHLMQGAGVERDPQAAVRLFTAAAEEGNRDAQFLLASAHEFGNGVEQDWSQAARWHRAAAEQGHATSQVRLGGQYLAGNGVERDFVESYAWLTLALESSDPQASALAQGVLMALKPKMSAEQIQQGEALAEKRRR